MNATLNSESNDTRTNSVTYNCTSDLANAAKRSSIHSITSVVSIQAVCEREPPGQRDVYLALDRCFLLSNRSITHTNNGTSTTQQQVLYAKLDCNFADTTTFITKLYDNDETCGDPMITRTIEMLECEVWFHENETGFPFPIMAKVKLT